LKPGLFGEMPATHHLSYGMAAFLMLDYEVYFLNVTLIAIFVEQEFCTVESKVHETWHNVF